MRRACLIPLVALLIFAGCGGDDEKKPSGSGAAKAKTSESTATTPAGKRTTVPEKAIASSDGSIGEVHTRLELLQLKRGGDTSVLTLRLTAKAGGSVQIGSTFDDGVLQKSHGVEVHASDTSLDGITLIDTKNRKRYLVGRDSNGVCVCDSDLGAIFLQTDAPVLLSATFGAPPADVTAVDVAVPHYGTFKDVPIS